MISIVPFQVKDQQIDRKLVEQICQDVQQAFHQDCEIDQPVEVPQSAFHPERNQYSAENLLEALPEKEIGPVLGVANLDLYAPGLNFVFGLGDSSTNRAVIALPRLHNSFYGQPEDPQRFVDRAAKEAIHELGHTYGLKHCPDPHCVMYFSNTLADTDFKSKNFCSHCGDEIIQREH